ncbi:MAG: VOC family protein [Polyangiales bacterium]
MPSSKFFWFDLLTPDVAASRSFYGGLAGWTTEAVMDGGYHVINAGPVGVGGILSNASPDGSQPPAPPSWLGYIWVEDVDASIARAVKLGAALQMPARDIPGVGRFGIVRDPQGAHVALFRPTPPPGQQHDPGMSEERGRIVWTELYTSDWKAALTFYGELLGWKKVDEMDMGEQGTYALFNFGEGDAMGGTMNIPDVPPQWIFYISVADADAAAEQIVKQGGQVVFGPMDVPGGGRAAQCIDPQGAAFGIHSRKAS